MFSTFRISRSIKTIGCVCLFAVSLPALAASNNSAQSLQQYQTQATALLSVLDARQSENLESKAKQLVQTSKPIVEFAKTRFPQCTTYFDALINAAEIIPTLPLAEIESGYHADGKLPPLTDGHCYHVKDLLVHAATVEAMAKQGIKTDEGWQAAKHEIEEVIEHFDVVEASLLAK